MNVFIYLAVSALTLLIGIGILMLSHASSVVASTLFVICLLMSFGLILFACYQRAFLNNVLPHRDMQLRFVKRGSFYYAQFKHLGLFWLQFDEPVLKAETIDELQKLVESSFVRYDQNKIDQKVTEIHFR